MSQSRLKRMLPALIFALAVAYAPPVRAQQGAAAIPKITTAEVPYGDARQARLLERQIATLKPQQQGVTDIYVVAVAGWADQDVFRRELAGAVAALGQALPVSGREVRLINSRETRKEIPLASRQNFAAAIRAVAKIMDKQEDVLVLFMTSHGNESGIGLQLPTLLVPFSPAEVAAVLGKEGIKNRVVIVSACFSGIFVKPLANADTIVLTAADARSQSFGCTSGRDWTYFGEALFHHGLKPGVDLQLAFTTARGLITGWEKFERVKPSNPQAHFGEALVRKLAPLIEARGQADWGEQE